MPALVDERPSPLASLGEPKRERHWIMIQGVDGHVNPPVSPQPAPIQAPNRLSGDYGIVTLGVVEDGMLNECLATCTVAIDFRRRSFHIVFGSTFVLV
jgi:hypothetical protein